MWLMLFLLTQDAPPRAGWVDVGLDEGRRSAVQIDGVPNNDVSQPFAAVYVTVRPQPAGRPREYTLWLGRYDCEARTRTRSARFEYSPHHDPRRTLIDEGAVTEQQDATVARQLDVLCNRHRLKQSNVMSIAAFVAAD